jgi:hypothetical protein
LWELGWDSKMSSIHCCLYSWCPQLKDMDESNFQAAPQRKH